MPRGGKRTGAGRKPNTGLYKTKTVAKRIPEALLPILEPYLDNWKEAASTSSLPFSGQEELYRPLLSRLECPLFLSQVAAGFPSPADDTVESALDLNTHLIKNPSATFFVRVSGESMMKAGIHPGDLLVVDRSIFPKHNHIVIAVVNGELTVKRLHLKHERITLMPENNLFDPLPITKEMDFRIWGVVTSVIHSVIG